MIRERYFEYSALKRRLDVKIEQRKMSTRGRVVRCAKLLSKGNIMVKRSREKRESDSCRGSEVQLSGEAATIRGYYSDSLAFCTTKNMTLPPYPLPFTAFDVSGPSPDVII